MACGQPELARNCANINAVLVAAAALAHGIRHFDAIGSPEHGEKLFLCFRTLMSQDIPQLGDPTKLSPVEADVLCSVLELTLHDKAPRPQQAAVPPEAARRVMAQSAPTTESKSDELKSDSFEDAYIEWIAKVVGSQLTLAGVDAVQASRDLWAAGYIFGAHAAL